MYYLQFWLIQIWVIANCESFSKWSSQKKLGVAKSSYLFHHHVHHPIFLLILVTVRDKRTWCCKIISEKNITATRDLQETKWGNCEEGWGHVYCQFKYKAFDCNEHVFGKSGDELQCPPKVERKPCPPLPPYHICKQDLPHEMYVDFGCHRPCFLTWVGVIN